MGEARRSDADVIAASRQNPESFGEIFTRHHDAVFAFVSRRIGDQGAVDVTATVFERAFKIRVRYRPSESSCLPWLYGIAYNILGDRLRKQRSDQRIYLAIPRESDSADWSGDADSRVAAQLAGSRVNEALGSLSPADRETFLLFALERLTYAEIAQALSVPIGTIGSRISRVRARILEEIPDLEQITRSEAPGTEDD